MTIDRIDESAQFVSAFFEDEMPKTAIILGSGLSALADQIEDVLLFHTAVFPILHNPRPKDTRATLLSANLEARPLLPCKAASTTTKATAWTK